MKSILRNTIVLGLTISIAGCSSTTAIKTVPSGTKVYLDDAYKGVTPYTHKDTKVVGSRTNLRFEKEGFQPLNTALTRDEKADVGAIIGGVLVPFPFIWTIGYDAEHT